MSKTKQESSDAILEIAEMNDRLGDWVANNPAIVVSVIVAVLLIAGALGGMRAYQQNQAEAAFSELNELRASLLEALGGSPGDVELPEPANPELARETRSGYAQRFQSFAEDHAGSAAAGLAQLEAGDLLQVNGELAAAETAWETARDTLGSGSSLAALVELRLARTHEDAGRWQEAAEAYGRAGAVDDFPLRQQSLAQSARAYQHAEMPDKAREMAAAVDLEDSSLRLPEHLDAVLGELSTPISE